MWLLLYRLRLNPATAYHTNVPRLYRPLYGAHGAYGGGGLESITMHGTTILCVRKGSKVVMMGDGQVSQGYTVVKPNAKKVRKPLREAEREMRGGRRRTDWCLR